ncbi:DUF916 and DUF3324 domain-containing protein [Vagococcus salmoninarum]|uniref:DUF916 and DUF3324 domain-containing protein n=1 Tax=Vagococcus salmoninarum TaxID=2739 RepID=UPI001880DEBB|nr:DUF916 and DUF3324 domain-containing protein [Vagococcus salmoninarum]MBE9388220.1 DUF916 and DUF3324 domain-containing protein [Vagococcus salmoninarum]
MKRMLNYLIVTIGLGLFGSLVSEEKVLAANPSTNVSVTTNQPKNQIDKNQSFFDVLLAPGATQELEVVLRNNTEKDLVMLASVNTAVTNDNGVVDYSWSVPFAQELAKENNQDPANLTIDVEKIAYDSTLKVPLSTIATIAPEIKVPANSETIAKVTVDMPKEAIRGVIAGGVYLSQKADETENEETNQGVQIKNKFVYVVGVQLRQKADISELLPELILDPAKISPTQVNYRNYLGVNLQNSEPIYIRDLKVDAQITKKGQKGILFETAETGLKMAPNSNFNFGINWNNQEFKGGKYRLQLKARSEDYDKEWSWEEDFTIESDIAKKLNQRAVELDKNSNLLLYLIILALILLIILLVIAYLMKRHLDKKKEMAKGNKQRQNKKPKS